MHGPVAQLVSVPPCHGGGRGFKSRQGRSTATGPFFEEGLSSRTRHPRMPRGSVAQLVERTTENREVTGSTPVGATETLVRLLLTGVSLCPIRCNFLPFPEALLPGCSAAHASVSASTAAFVPAKCLSLPGTDGPASRHWSMTSIRTSTNKGEYALTATNCDHARSSPFARTARFSSRAHRPAIGRISAPRQRCRDRRTRFSVDQPMAVGFELTSSDLSPMCGGFPCPGFRGCRPFVDVHMVGEWDPFILMRLLTIY